MTKEAARIQGQRRRLFRCNYGPEELATMTNALVEEDEPKGLTTTKEALAGEEEEMKRGSEHL